VSLAGAFEVVVDAGSAAAHTELLAPLCNTPIPTNYATYAQNSSTLWMNVSYFGMDANYWYRFCFGEFFFIFDVERPISKRAAKLWR